MLVGMVVFVLMLMGCGCWLFSEIMCYEIEWKL